MTYFWTMFVIVIGTCGNPYARQFSLLGSCMLGLLLFFVYDPYVAATYKHSTLFLRDCIHKSSFSSLLTNGLDCYVTLDWKGLQVTNTPAYLVHLQVAMYMKWCEYDPSTSLVLKSSQVASNLEDYAKAFFLSIALRQNKLECLKAWLLQYWKRPKRLASVKYSSILAHS
jgi:hypothetical protein